MAPKLVKFLASFGYLGFAPFASGSLASTAGALICFALAGNTLPYIFAFVAITLLGFAVSGPMEKISGEKDPSCVVIDEVSGSFIAFFGLPLHWPVLITAFFLYRAFDMFKIYPANRFESLGGSLGIMADDLVAGLYTFIVMHAAVFILGIS